jgi:hypothetical protein
MHLLEFTNMVNEKLEHTFQPSGAIGDLDDCIEVEWNIKLFELNLRSLLHIGHLWIDRG